MARKVIHMLTRREYQRWKRTRTKATSLGPAFWNDFLEPEEIENHALCTSSDDEAEYIIMTQYVRGYRTSGRTSTANRVTGTEDR